MITQQKMVLYKSKFSYRTQSNLWWKIVENNKKKIQKALKFIDLISTYKLQVTTFTTCKTIIVII